MNQTFTNMPVGLKFYIQSCPEWSTTKVMSLCFKSHFSLLFLHFWIKSHWVSWRQNVFVWYIFGLPHIRIIHKCQTHQTYLNCLLTTFHCLHNINILPGWMKNQLRLLILFYVSLQTLSNHAQDTYY